MKKAKLSFGLVAVTVFLLQLATPLVNAAGNAALLLNPSSTSIAKDAEVAIEVRINTNGETVNAVQADLTYPADKLEFVSVSGGGSAFAIEAANTGGSGTISIARGNITNVTGNALIATVRLKAIVAASSATIAFAASSSAVSSGNDVTGTKTGTTITLAADPSSPVVPPTKPKPSDPAVPTPPNPSAPVIEKAAIVSVEHKGVMFTRAVIGVQLSKAADVYIRYGLSQGNLEFTTGRSKGLQAYDIPLDQNILTPGVTYYYQAVVVHSNGSETMSDVQSFTTQGYGVTLVVLDKDKKPVAERQVRLHPSLQEAMTDKEGRVSFDNLAPGNYQVEILGSSDEWYPFMVTGAIQESDGIQFASALSFDTVFSSSYTSNKLRNISLIVVPALIVVLGVAYLIMRTMAHRRFSYHAMHTMPPQNTAVVMSDHPLVEDKPLTPPTGTMIPGQSIHPDQTPNMNEDDKLN